MASSSRRAVAIENLSHLLPGDPISALVPTGQGGGNQVTDLSHARTAPGSQPSTPYTSLDGEIIDHPAPVVGAVDHQRTVLEDGHDVGLDGGKPVLKLGTWNNL